MTDLDYESGEDNCLSANWWVTWDGLSLPTTSVKFYWGHKGVKCQHCGNDSFEDVKILFNEKEIIASKCAKCGRTLQTKEGTRW